MVRMHSRFTSALGGHQNTTMLFAACCSYLAALSFGQVVGYSSPAIPDMESKHLLASQGAAVFGALMTVGGMVGCPLAGWALERFGRKKSLVFSCIPMILGWLSIALSGPMSTNWLYLGRLLTGVASGMSTVVMSVYVAETSTKEHRGMLGSGVQLAITIGILIVYTLGIVCDWRVLAALGCVFPVMAMLLSTKVPETPRWYLFQGRKAEAVRALQHLRGTMDVEDELDDIIEGLPDKGDTFAFVDLLKPEVWRPLKVVMILMVFQQATGINVVMFYTVTIFESAGFKNWSIGATIAVGAVQVVVTAGAVYMMDKAGRRPLLFLGGAIMAMSCFTMGLYYHWAAVAPIPHLTWMALASLVFYIVGFSIGWGPVPGLIMSEVFPVKARGTASAISCICNWGTAFIITAKFLSFVQIFGHASAYWFFCFVTLLGTLLVHIYVPETKGKSLEEIELYFLGRVMHGV